MTALDAGSPPFTPADLDYDLPDAVIAQTPLPERDRSRLLVDHGCGIPVSHRRVSDLPEFLSPGDLLVVNDSRVLPARLRLRRVSGGAAEILLLEDRGDGSWEALARPSRRLKPGEVLEFDVEPDEQGCSPQPESGQAEQSGRSRSESVRPPCLKVEIGDDLGGGHRIVKLEAAGVSRGTAAAGVSRGTAAALAAVGEMPLPPYIDSQIADPERYQTVFGRRPVSASAPTAGLHLTLDLFDRVRAAGAEIASIELAIGVDTFRPITAERINDHVMHTERYRIPVSTARAVASAKRVVAVGTTVVRALETFAVTGEPEGRSGLFIRRPFEWRSVDLLMTNFHLPRSSLLCLVDAFVGPRWKDLYTEALAVGYRFLSFGDAMLLTGDHRTETA